MKRLRFVLTRETNTYRAAAFIARQIARQFARQATIDIATEVRISLSDRAKQYFEMARDMEHQANVGAGGGGGLGVLWVAYRGAEAGGGECWGPGTPSVHQGDAQHHHGAHLDRRREGAMKYLWGIRHVRYWWHCSWEQSGATAWYRSGRYGGPAE